MTDAFAKNSGYKSGILLLLYPLSFCIKSEKLFYQILVDMFVFGLPVITDRSSQLHGRHG